MNQLAMTVCTGKTDQLYREQWEAILSVSDRLVKKCSTYTVFSEPLQFREDLLQYAALGLILACTGQDSFCNTIEQTAIELAIDEIYTYVDNSFDEEDFGIDGDNVYNSYIAKLVNSLAIIVTGYVYLLWEGMKVNEITISRLGTANDVTIHQVNNPRLVNSLNFEQFTSPNLSTYMILCGDN